MKRTTTFFISFLFAFTSFAQTQFSRYVNPFIGTGGHGHTFPGALLPFGMMQLSPDTRLDGWDGCSGYHYSDSVIYGFSHTHLSGTGCSDYGDILLMPVTEEMPVDHYQYASTFSHKKEHAETGYYQVFLDKPKVNAELTATLRCGMHRYTFPKNAPQMLVLDLKHRDEVLDSKLEILDSFTLRGYRFSRAWARNQKVFFEIKFSKPFDGQSLNVKTVQTKNIIALFRFKNDGKPLLVKVAISAVDENGAHKNMQEEMLDWNFEKYKKNAQNTWNKELSKIDVRGGTKDQKTIFYTALYHSMSAPNIYNDVDGRYRGRDDAIHNTEGKFDYYTVFSLWDTYRAEHPLLSIIDTKRTNDFINTFIKEYEQGGLLPVWELSSNETYCMIGYHSVPVIWDAYSKGIRNYDAEKAFEAMKHSAMTDYFGLKSYKKYGYVRSEDDHESVSKTLEYAYDDWCIAQMAKALNKTEDYKYFIKRSQNWENVYDPTTGFMRARRNGTLYEPFSPYLVDNNYTEGNSWQYSFAVQHDVDGLIALSGGKVAFEEKLDALFNAKTETDGKHLDDISGLIGQYAHGNEPSHHIAYLYDYVGKPEKTQAILRQVTDSFYKNAPDGLIGNEDCGQMSAWYVMTAMGFYPVCTSTSEYELGVPVFDSIIINGGVKTDVITKKSMVQMAAEANGKHVHFVFRQSGNAKTAFVENASWNEDMDNQIVPNPYIIGASKIFRGQEYITIQCVDKDAEIFYSFNNMEFAKYTVPLPISQNTDIRFYTQKGKEKSPVQEANFTKLPDDRSITLLSEYNKSYPADGKDALIDGLRGNLNWRKGYWQGYQNKNFAAVIAFKKERTIRQISADFLEDQRSWIFYPTEVSYFSSNDSLSWKLITTIHTNKPDHDEKVKREAFVSDKTVQARYIKIVAKNFGKVPAWHEDAGSPTYLFLDEIEIK